LLGAIYRESYFKKLKFCIRGARNVLGKRGLITGLFIRKKRIMWLGSRGKDGG
jgi:hypothetical protein